jgi:hypothetical protein
VPCVPIRRTGVSNRSKLVDSAVCQYCPPAVVVRWVAVENEVVKASVFLLLRFANHSCSRGFQVEGHAGFASLPFDFANRNETAKELRCPPTLTDVFIMQDFQEIGLTPFDPSCEFIDRLMYSEKKGVMICLLGNRTKRSKRCFVKYTEELTYREVFLPFEAREFALNDTMLVATNEVESLVHGKHLWYSFEPGGSIVKACGEVSLAFHSLNTRRKWVYKFIESNSDRLHCIFACEQMRESGGGKVQYCLGKFDVETGAITLVRDLGTPFA